MIETRNLTKKYSQGDETIFALDHLNMQIQEGEFVAVVGKSGSGKSTLLHLLGGLDDATEGEVLYDQQDLLKMKDKELNLFRRKNIGFVFQDYNLIPELTGEENIKFPAMLAANRVEESYFQKLVERLELGDRISHLPSQMSGGQQQRVAIARAFINQPKVVLCDEPTGNLDSDSGNMVMNLIKNLKEEFHQTVLVVTHDPDYAKRADRIITLKDGTLI